MTRDSLAKVNVSIGILLSVLALILAACGDSTENTTVDEVSDATDNTPGASAQERVETACETQRAELNYDLSMVITSSPSDYWHLDEPKAHRWEYTSRVSGEDFHMTVNFTEISSWIEVISVDGVTYYREKFLDAPETSWAQIPDFNNMGLAEVYLPPHFSGNDFCPDTGVAGSQGKETLDGAQVDRYRVSYSQPAEGSTETTGVAAGASDSEKATDYVWDIWINGDGELVQVKQYITSPLFEGDTERATGEFLHKISGIGEANDIQAPELAGS